MSNHIEGDEKSHFPYPSQDAEYNSAADHRAVGTHPSVLQGKYLSHRWGKQGSLCSFLSPACSLLLPFICGDIYTFKGGRLNVKRENLNILHAISDGFWSRDTHLPEVSMTDVKPLTYFRGACVFHGLGVFQG